MPNYDYKCDKCGITKEFLLIIKEALPYRQCCSCLVGTMKKQIGHGGYINFKGEDFPGENIRKSGWDKQEVT